ncbi:MAG TPA: hypothetical protein VFM35_00470 [Candidatus Binatia bacterium]|nr:hypothetical protein [Candidatus Binatia bacterium]
MPKARSTIGISENSTAHNGHYSKALRAIGYVLETLQVEAFEVTCEGRNYIVRVEGRRHKKPRMKGILKKNGLQVLQQIFPSRCPVDNPSVGLQLVYTPEDIERLHDEGQSRRRNASNLDPHSLPQALRAIGAYIHLKNARLVQISRDGPFTTVRYETPTGGLSREEFTPASLYALFVRMYLKRTDRAKAK